MSPSSSSKAGTKALAVPASRTWNICMLAHVDHGKSALSDALISSNGIINPRLAGRVRYLDSRADEQRRGITMKSSSIALGSRDVGSPDAPLRIVNLVDSPGHIDFTGEVGAALRVCDGAIVVVDVVEGVCVQTVGVLRAALEHAVRPVLVLNKLDRLFVELQLGPMEAYWHIQRVIEQVNVIMGVRQVEDMMAKADMRHGTSRSSSRDGGDGEVAGDMEKESEWSFDAGEDEAEDNVSGYFSPERGNVAFASALDCWAFRLDEFAALFSAKFGISRSVLRKTLWGEYYLQSKSKKIVRKAPRGGNAGAGSGSSNAKPMFVQFVLSSLHSVYEGLYSTQHDHEAAIARRSKIVERLGLSIPARDLKHKDVSVALRAIMAAWLPSAPALLNLVFDCLPSAAQAQRDPDRRAVLWPFVDVSNEDAVRQRVAIETADSSHDAPLLAYVTKMLEPVSKSSASGGRANIRHPKSRETAQSGPKESVEPSDGSHENSERAVGGTGEDVQSGDGQTSTVSEEPGLVAFARMMSGTVKVGDQVWVYGPRYSVNADGSYDSSTVSKARVTDLFLLMGRDMENVSMAVSGAVVGIGGLSDAILKTATVSSVAPGKCLPLGSVTGSAALRTANDAVVRVAVEPHLPGDVPILQNGLRQLNQADPAVDTYVTAMGEHVIAASGELHLERCLLDLRERFAAGIQIHVSPPIISFRETIFGGSSVDPISSFLDGFKQAFSHPLVADSRIEQESSGSQLDVAEGGVNDRYARGVQHSKRMGDTNPLDPTEGWGVRLQGTEGYPPSLLPVTENSRAGKEWEPHSSSFLKCGRFVHVGNEVLSFRLCSSPIPPKLSMALDEVGVMLRASAPEKAVQAPKGDPKVESLREKIRAAIVEDSKSGIVRPGLSESFVTFWGKQVLSRVWSCGPRQFGSNFIVGDVPGKNVSPWVRSMFGPDGEVEDGEAQTPNSAKLLREVEAAIGTGFQLGVHAGPLCEEPMHGVAFFIDEVRVNESVMTSGSGQGATLPSSIAGLVISSTKEATRLSFLNSNPRIMEAALNVEVSVPGDALGRTYTVLAKRRGRVLLEDMKDGVNVFNIEALLPLTESFGFAEALRKQTSGFASAQMMFCHWEAVEADPFWAPRTVEELEDLGLADGTEANNNLARKLLSNVRRRKGLRLEQKIVENAEKQRTLSKKK